MATTRTRLTRDDLNFLYAWVESYDGGPDDDENQASRERIMQWAVRELGDRALADTQRQIEQSLKFGLGNGKVTPQMRKVARRKARRLHGYPA